MTVIICVLLIPGILLVMDEGVFFPVSNVIGLLMLCTAVLVLRHREQKRCTRNIGFVRPNYKLALSAGQRPRLGDEDAGFWKRVAAVTARSRR